LALRVIPLLQTAQEIFLGLLVAVAALERLRLLMFQAELLALHSRAAQLPLPAPSQWPGRFRQLMAEPVSQPLVRELRLHSVMRLTALMAWLFSMELRLFQFQRAAQALQPFLEHRQTCSLLRLGIAENI
jgi:hypothetical protein